MTWLTRLKDTFQDWNARRKIWGYQKRLDQLTITRRGFLSGATTLALSPFLPAPLPEPVLREKIVTEYLKTKAGRLALAQAMIQPLRMRMNYTALARQLVPVQQLPEAKVTYFKDE
jgi:hypothetical protein